jgi:hypothetical protein
VEKSQYERSTRECAFDELQPALAAAIKEHVQDRELGDVLSKVLICCETTSERRRLGRLQALKARLGGTYDPDPVHYTGVVVTPSWLIWGTSGEQRGTQILSARLREIEVQDYAKELARFKEVAKLGIEDTGITIFGVIGGFRERASAFIGLGREEAAEKLKRVLRETIQKANAPSQ